MNNLLVNNTFKRYDISLVIIHLLHIYKIKFLDFLFFRILNYIYNQNNNILAPCASLLDIQGTP